MIQLDMFRDYTPSPAYVQLQEAVRKAAPLMEAAGKRAAAQIRQATAKAIAITERVRTTREAKEDSCRFILAAIDRKTKRGNGRTTTRHRLLTGGATDQEAEAIIYAAAGLRAEYVRTSGKRIRRELRWNGETISI